MQDARYLLCGQVEVRDVQDVVHSVLKLDFLAHKFYRLVQ